MIARITMWEEGRGRTARWLYRWHLEGDHGEPCEVEAEHDYETAEAASQDAQQAISRLEQGKDDAWEHREAMREQYASETPW